MIIGCNGHVNRGFPFLHAELRRNILAENACLRVGKIRCLCFINRAFVRKEQQIRGIDALHLLNDSVALF